MQQGSVGCYGNQVPVILEKNIVNDLKLVRNDDPKFKDEVGDVGGKNLAADATHGTNEVKVKMETPDVENLAVHGSGSGVAVAAVKKESRDGCEFGSVEAADRKTDFSMHKVNVDAATTPFAKLHGSEFLKPQYQTHHPHAGFHHPAQTVGAFPGMGSKLQSNYNFQNFYAAASTASFHTQHSTSLVNKANNVHGHIQNNHHQQHHPNFRGRPLSNETNYHHRFNNNFHQVNNHSKLPTGSYTPVSYNTGFQANSLLTSSQTSVASVTYNNHQNNNYRTHYPRHRKWNNPAGLRALHPPMPVSSLRRYRRFICSHVWLSIRLYDICRTYLM